MSESLNFGNGVYSFNESTGVTDDPINVYYYRPKSWHSGDPIALVLHGMYREAENYLNDWKNHADNYNILLVCPKFTNEKYPGGRYYNNGNVIDDDGIFQSKDDQVFPIINRIVDDIKDRTNSSDSKILLYGHSAGAQFVHRYVLLDGETSFDLIITANAGYYTMPDEDIQFSYGIGGLSITEAQLTDIFSKPVVVLLGEEDTVRDDMLNKSSKADAQGLNRLERGKEFYRQMKVKAQTLGVEFNWKLETVPGVGHNDYKMSQAAIDIYLDVLGGISDCHIDNDENDIKLVGSLGNDTISNFGKNVTLNGNVGNDNIYNADQASLSVINGDNGDDLINNYGNKVTMYDNDGKNDIHNFGNNVIIYSGNDDDSVENFGSGATIYAGKGNDTVISNGNTSEIYGSEGADYIHNFGNNVTAYGGVGDDYIINRGINVIIAGSDGNDTIFNGVQDNAELGSSSSLVGGVGDDYISNYGRNSTITSGAGNDTIVNYFDADLSVIYSRDGNDYVINYSNNVKIYTSVGNDTVEIGDYNVRDYRYAKNVVVSCGEGDDYIIKYTLNGVVYQYASGDGDDTIIGYSENDTLRVTGSYDIMRNGNDVVVNVDSGTILLKDFFNSSINVNSRTVTVSSVENIPTSTIPVGISINGATLTATTQFTGNSIKLADYSSTVTRVNAFGLSKAVEIVGNTANNSLVGGSGADTLSGGRGNDTLTGSNGKDTFVYTAGNDVISDYVAGQDKIKIVGGSIIGASLSGNDVVLRTDSGTMTVKNGKGKQLTVIDSSGRETTQIYPSVSAETIPAGLSVKNAVMTASNKFTDNKIDLTQFNAVTKVDASSLSQAVEIIGNASNNALVGGKGADTIIGGAGNDTLTGGTGADVFVYSGGNDLITDYKFAEDKILLDVDDIKSSTLKGSDVIIVMSTDSLTVKGVKDKAITFIDSDGNAQDLIFYSGDRYTPLETGLSYDAKRLTLTANAKFTGNAIALEDYISPNVNASALKQNIEINGNDSNNLLKSGKGADTLRGGDGNDTLTGGSGKDVFVYSGGNDLITDYKTAEDKIQLDVDEITSSTLKGSDVIIGVGIDSLTVKGVKDKAITFIDSDGNITDKIFYAGESYAPLETGLSYDAKRTALTANAKLTDSEIDLSDYLASVKKFNASAVKQAMDITATDNAVLLQGSKFADTLRGGDGNDTLTGGTGADVFVYSGGNDLITDYKSGEDTIRLADSAITNYAVSGSNVILTTNKGALTVKGVKNKNLTVIDASGAETTGIYDVGGFYKSLPVGLSYDAKKTTLTTSAKFTGNAIDLSEYNPTLTNINAASAKTAVKLSGNDSGNVLKGGKSADTITGGSGNDTLTGGSGKDIFVYSNGNDLITDYKSGEDTIKLQNGTITSSTMKGSDVLLTTDSGTITVKKAKSKQVTVIDTNGTTSKVYGVLSYNSSRTAVTLDSSFSGTLASSDYDSTVTTINASKVSKAVNIFGNDKANSIVGSGKNDTLNGGEGNDTLTGGKGNDILTGGAGSDLFVYANGDGKDVITDYTATDTIKLTSGKIDKTTYSGNDAVLKIGNGSITVKNGKNVTISVMNANGNITTIGNSSNVAGLWFAEDNNFISNDLDAITNEADNSVDKLTNYSQDLTPLEYSESENFTTAYLTTNK